MKKILLIMVLFLGLVLRFYQLGENPASLDWDEASLGYNAYSVLKTGKDEYGNFLPLSIRSFNDYKPPLYTYLSVASVYVFGLNEFAVRFIAAATGCFAVLGAFLLAKIISGRHKFALLVSFLLAVSPWHLQFSRVAFEAQVALFLIIFALFFYLKGLKNGVYFLVSSVFFGLSLYAYHSPRLLVPVLIAGLSWLNWQSFRKKLAWIFLFSAVLTAFYLPVLSEIGQSTKARFASVSVINPDEKLGQSIKFQDYDTARGFAAGKILHNRRLVFAREILAGYLDHFNFDFLFLTGDAPGRHHAAGIGMLYLAELPFILIGLSLLLKRPFSKISGFVFLILLASPIASSLTSGTPHAVRAIYFLPVYQILASLGIMELIKSLKQNSAVKNLQVVFLAVCLLLTANFYYYLHQYYVHTPVEHALDWQYGYKEAVNIANNYYDQVDKIIFTYEYDQPYVFFLFFNKIDPVWYQGNWGEGEINRSKRNFGKYEFRNIDWETDSLKNNVLIVGTPKEIPENAQGLVARVVFPDGSDAFRIVLKQ